MIKNKKKKLEKPSKSISKDKKKKQSKQFLEKRGKSEKERKLKNKLKSKSREKPERKKRNKSEKSSSSKNKTNNNKKYNKKEEDKKESNKYKKDGNNKKEKDYISIEDISYKNNDLYSLLGLPNSATNLEIRKAYKHLVLLFHPDKNKRDPEASSKFINITKAYKILSNEKSRKYYDETGEYDEENKGQIDIDDTLNYFRKIYSSQDIESYENKYIGSKEEERDLINYYNENNGDLTNILECIPCSKNEDINRFLNIYKNLFKKKILIKNNKYEETINKIKLIKDDINERKEAEETLDKLSKQIILNKKKRNYNDYLNGLAKKYGDIYNENEFENSEIS